jgi:hypothetical protein
MKPTHTIVLTSLALTSILPITPPTAALATTVDIVDADATSPLSIIDVTRRGDTISGTLINRGGEEIRGIRLLVDLAFLWKNEVEPGDDSPGRSVVLTVDGPLPPHGRLAFELTLDPPLPTRTDGRFVDPQVHVMGYSCSAGE